MSLLEYEARFVAIVMFLGLSAEPISVKERIPLVNPRVVDFPMSPLSQTMYLPLAGSSSSQSSA